MDPDEEMLRALDEIVAFDSEQQKERRKPGKRSSILKRNDDPVTEDLQSRRKSVNSKRVSFADKFQVMEMHTGNIYDISGKSNSTLPKDSIQNEDFGSEFSEESVFETVSRKNICISSSVNVKVTEDENFSQSSLAMKHKIDSDSDFEPGRKKFHYKNISSVPGAENTFTDSSEIENRECRHGSDNQYDKENQCFGSILHKNSGSDNSLYQSRPKRNIKKLVSNNLNVPQTENISQERNISYKINEPRQEKKSRKVVQEFSELKETILPVIENKQNVCLTNKVQDTKLYPLLLTDELLVESKENMYIDQKNKSIVITNPRNLKLKERSELLDKNSYSHIKSTGVNNCIPEPSKRKKSRDVRENSHLNKSCILTTPMDLTCVSEMNNTNDSESFSLQNDVTSADPLLYDESSILHGDVPEKKIKRDQGNKTILNITCHMDLTCNLQNFSNPASDFLESSKKVSMVAFPNDLTSEIDDTEKRNPSKKQVQKEEEPSSNMDFTCYHLDSKVPISSGKGLEHVFVSESDKISQLNENLKKSSSLSGNNEKGIGASDFMELTCNPQNSKNVTCSPSSSEKEIPLSPPNLVHQEPSEEFCMKSFANKTMYETSCIMDETCKPQDLTNVESDSPEISAKDSVDLESFKLIVDHQKLGKQNIENMDVTSYQKYILLQEKLTTDKTSNYMELTCNPQHMTNMTCSPQSIETKCPSILQNLVPQQPNEEFYMKSFANKTLLESSYTMDLTCNPQYITNMELDSSEISVKDTSKLIIESQRHEVQSKEIIEASSLQKQFHSPEKITIDKTCMLNCSMQVTCVQPEIHFTHELDNSMEGNYIEKENALKSVHSPEQDRLNNQANPTLMSNLGYNHNHLNKTKFDASHCMELTCNVQNMVSKLPEMESNNMLNTLASSPTLVSEDIDKNCFKSIILDGEKCNSREMKKYDIDDAYEKNLKGDFTKLNVSSNFQSSNLLIKDTKNNSNAINEQKNPNTQKLGEFLFSSNNAGETLFNKKIKVGLNGKRSEKTLHEAIQDSMENLDTFSEKVDKNTDEVVNHPSTSFRNQTYEETNNSILDVFDENFLKSKQDEFLFTESTPEPTCYEKSGKKTDKKLDIPVENSSVSSKIHNRISTRNEVQNDACPLFVHKTGSLDVKKSEVYNGTSCLSPNIVFALKQLKDMNKPISNDNVCKLPEVFFSVKKQAMPNFSSSNSQQSETARHRKRQFSNVCNEELSFISESQKNSAAKCGLSVIPSSSSAMSPGNNTLTVHRITRSASKTVTKKLFATNCPSKDDVDSILQLDSSPILQCESSKPVELLHRNFQSDEKNPEVKNMLEETKEKEKVSSIQEIETVLESCSQVLVDEDDDLSIDGKEEVVTRRPQINNICKQSAVVLGLPRASFADTEETKECFNLNALPQEENILETVPVKETSKELALEPEKVAPFGNKMELEEQKRKEEKQKRQEEEEKQRLKLEKARIEEEKKLFEENEKQKQILQKLEKEEQKRKEEKQKRQEEEEKQRLKLEKARIEEEKKLLEENEKQKQILQKKEEEQKRKEEKQRSEAEKARLKEEKKLLEEKEKQKRIQQKKEEEELKRKEEEKQRLEFEIAKLKEEKMLEEKEKQERMQQKKKEEEQKRKEEEEKLRLEAEKAKLEKEKQKLLEKEKEEQKRKEEEDHEKQKLKAKKAKLEEEKKESHQKNREDDYEIIHTLRKKMIEASKDEDCRWCLQHMDDERAVFEILYDSIFATYVMDISLKREADVLTCVTVSFSHNKEDDIIDENDEIGFLLFKTRVDSALSLFPFRFEQLPEILSTLQDFAIQAKSLICDIWPVHMKYKTSIDFSQNLPKFTVEIRDMERDSLFSLTFPIDLKTYPCEKIIPEVKHLDYEQINPEIILESLSKIQPGEDYLSNMVHAVKAL